MNHTSMEYEEFVQEIITAVEGKLPDDGSCRVSVMPVRKNNQVRSDTLTIRGEGRTCAPVIHLNEVYDCYENGMSVDDLAGQITDIYNDSADHFTDLTSELLFDFDYVKDRIILKLINYDRNREILKDVPHIRRLDLALTFRLFAESEDHMAGSIMIDNTLMEIWGCTLQTLFELASENTNRMWKPVMVPMDSLICDMLENMENCPDEPPTSPLVVMTNEKFCLGAATLFCTDQLKNYAQHTGYDYYILPSSIHEVLLLPCTADLTPEGLAQMVQNVNADVVSDEDFLSDHVYIYCRKDDRLTIAGRES